LEASLFSLIGESKVGINCLSAEFRLGRVDVDFAVATYFSGVSLNREEEGGGDGSELHHGFVVIDRMKGKL
jgi:hypothetical protein